MTHRLAYFSRNRINGSDTEILAEIDQILTTSQRNNARVGVTGALLFNSGGFAQVLEGENEYVSQVFERIQNDPRHADVLVLDYGKADERMFPNWSMGFLGKSKSHARLFGAVSEHSGFSAESTTAKDLFAAIKRILMEEELVA